jgi:hypothetical protein
MIELIEVPVHSADEGECNYRKSLVILLPDFEKWNRVLMLKSRTLYRSPISKKRWKLIERFKKEGCRLVRSALAIDPSRRYRKRYRMSLYDVVNLGHIYDSNIVEELRQVDVY